MNSQGLAPRENWLPRLIAIGALALWLAANSAFAQTPKKPNIFDDDDVPTAPKTNVPPGTMPPKANAPRPESEPPVVEAPAPGLVPGVLITSYNSPTPDGIPNRHYIATTFSIGFTPAATIVGEIPRSYSFASVFNIPAEGARGTFRFDTTGDSELAIDAKPVVSRHADDPANSFEHEVNLAPGLHAVTARVFHFRATGARLVANLRWTPAGGAQGRAPRAWFWHAKADEPVGTTALPKYTGSTGVGGSPAVETGIIPGWTKSGSPPPLDPAARPDDVLPKVVLELYVGQSFEQSSQFLLQPVAGVAMQIAPRPSAIAFLNGSYKIHGLLKIENELRATFDFPGSGQVYVMVDQHIVNRSGYSNAAATKETITLRPGIHILEVGYSRINLEAGTYAFRLAWSVDGAAFVEVPAEVLFHLRSQEPYAASAANRPTGGVPQPVPDVAAPVPAAAPRRLPIPDAESQARATAEMRERYAAQWSDPGTAVQAGFLIRAAGETRDDAVASYVLLQRASQQAQAAASMELAFRAIELLSSQFAVDSAGMKLAVLQGLGARGVGNPLAAAAILAVFNQAVADDNFSVAADAATLSLADARRRNVPAEIEAASQRVILATEASIEFPKMKPILERLAADPNDPAANLAVGRFYCFTAKNWQRGSAALARCNDPALSWLGKHEAAAVQSPTARLALANGWWDAADEQADAAVAAVMRERAAQWYNAAAPNLVGLSHRVAQRRLAKVPAAASLPSPFGTP